MKTITLTYHDVVADGDLDSSGFSGTGPAGPARYKVDASAFRRHLEVIKSCAQLEPTLVTDRQPDGPGTRLYLTFDDGGIGAATHAAGMLEEFGWRGHFFVVGDLIGRKAFMTADQIRDLCRRGHVIGSHSQTHPRVFLRLPYTEMVKEWRSSRELLTQLTGAPVTTAAVPGGHYSARVGAAAREAGIQHLFTSNPGLRVRGLAGQCSTYDRFGVFRNTPDATIGRYVSANRTQVFREVLVWKTKRAAKAVLGDLYLTVRRFLLRG
ncbi:MAG: polysaccharide deacetylase family protein [Vicinamibacterales bacterium]|nr:polysaccharide deacetylase family protein [Vicinamibacterales bacterium]